MGGSGTTASTARPTSDWVVYILRCGDDTLYTGITTDLARRFKQHSEGRGARYTRGRGPLEIVGSRAVVTRSRALRLEAFVKKATRDAKLQALLDWDPE